VIVLDSGVLIAFANPHDAHHIAVRDFLVGHAADPFSVASLSLAEALVHPSQANQYARVLESFMNLNLDVEDLRSVDAIPLALLRARTRLKMPDVVVLHAALSYGGAVATTDAALARVSEREGLTAHFLASGLA